MCLSVLVLSVIVLPHFFHILTTSLSLSLSLSLELISHMQIFFPNIFTAGHTHSTADSEGSVLSRYISGRRYGKHTIPAHQAQTIPQFKTRIREAFHERGDAFTLLEKEFSYDWINFFKDLIPPEFSGYGANQYKACDYQSTWACSYMPGDVHVFMFDAEIVDGKRISVMTHKLAMTDDITLPLDKTPRRFLKSYPLKGAAPAIDQSFYPMPENAQSLIEKYFTKIEDPDSLAYWTKFFKSSPRRPSATAAFQPLPCPNDEGGPAAHAPMALRQTLPVVDPIVLGSHTKRDVEIEQVARAQAGKFQKPLPPMHKGDLCFILTECEDAVAEATIAGETAAAATIAKDAGKAKPLRKGTRAQAVQNLAAEQAANEAYAKTIAKSGKKPPAKPTHKRVISLAEILEIIGDPCLINCRFRVQWFDADTNVVSPRSIFTPHAHVETELMPRAAVICKAARVEEDKGKRAFRITKESVSAFKNTHKHQTVLMPSEEDTAVDNSADDDSN